MPNSVPEIQKAMLKEIGVDTIEDLYSNVIPDELRFKGKMNIPEPIMSEAELSRHVNGLLNKNTSCSENINFLGAGCYQHYIPALCDEVANRSEFLTAYCGDTYSDHGKMQAIFEYASMMGELLDMDIVSYTTYDGGQAACSAMRMALRIEKGKKEILVPSTMNPEILSQAKNYIKSVGEVKKVKADKNGCMDLEHLEKQLKSGNAAAVFFENPSYLGFVEKKAEDIVKLAHKYGTICIVMPEVTSLGIMEAPANYGADLVCGEIQPLGMHLQMGGGCGGFIASSDDERYIQQYPTYLCGIAPTDKEGKFGWGRALNYRCSHGSRENANEYFGTESGLWAIVAGVYLASMGPQGMKELAETIMQRTAYAQKELRAIPGVKVNPSGAVNYQEFVVDFNATRMKVSHINEKLLDYHIFGGKDLSNDFPEMGQCALYCCSEMTGTEEIKSLKEALEKVLGGAAK